jgi:peptide-methionine (S)-S-oxide reductase
LTACSSEPSPAAPAASGQRATAVFAGGCFWCTESDFDKMPGVLATVSGYTGGRLRNPTYEQVSAGNTGHIEAVRVTYDPGKTNYTQLAARFMRTIDPLDAGGSFCDRGYQYRSAFFVADGEQKRVAEAVKARTQQALKKRVATLVLSASAFTPAEDYHQDYYKKNPIRYKFYRSRCGRDARLAEVWGGK